MPLAGSLESTKETYEVLEGLLEAQPSETLRRFPFGQELG